MPEEFLEKIDSIWSSEVNAYLCKYLGMLVNQPLQQHYLSILVMGFMSSHEVGEKTNVIGFEGFTFRFDYF